MQHVWVGENHIGAFANGAPGVGRRIAIVGERPQVRTHGFDRRIELVQLIFGQGLGGKQVQRAGLGFLHQMMKHWQVVAKCFAARCRRDHHHVLPRLHGVESSGLMRVKLAHSPLHIGRAQTLI